MDPLVEVVLLGIAALPMVVALYADRLIAQKSRGFWVQKWTIKRRRQGGAPLNQTSPKREQPLGTERHGKTRPEN
jgi:hypothetical protein